MLVKWKHCLVFRVFNTTFQESVNMIEAPLGERGQAGHFKGGSRANLVFTKTDFQAVVLNFLQLVTLFLCEATMKRGRAVFCYTSDM